MTGNIIKSSAPFACANYCLNHDEAEIIDWEGLDIDLEDAERLATSTGDDRLLLARLMAHAIDTSFKLQAEQNTAVEKPVAHIPLNFMKEDAPLLSTELMRKIASEYLEKMGWQNTQYMVVCHHNSKGNPHIHLFFNRVGNDGKVLNAWHDYERNSKVCKELTLKYGLHFSKGRQDTVVEDLKGKEKSKYEISNAIDKCLPGCKSWKELGRRLYAEGVSMTFAVRKDGNIQGVKFGKMGTLGITYEVSGSKIGRRYSYNHIDRAIKTGMSLIEIYNNNHSYKDNGFLLADFQELNKSEDTQGMELSDKQSSIISETLGILSAGLNSGSSGPQKDYEENKKKKRRGMRM